MSLFYSYLSQNTDKNPVKKAQILFNQFFPCLRNINLFNTQKFEYKKNFDIKNITIYKIC